MPQQVKVNACDVRTFAGAAQDSCEGVDRHRFAIAVEEEVRAVPRDELLPEAVTPSQKGALTGLAYRNEPFFVPFPQHLQVALL